MRNRPDAGASPVEPGGCIVANAWTHDSFKEATERTVAAGFIEFLGRERHIFVESSRAGATGEPDRVCTTTTGKTFGIEVASAHYSGADAAQLRHVVTDLAREGKRQTSMSTSGVAEADLPVGVIRNPDVALVESLRRAMLDHSLRRYGIPTFLVLDGSWAPLTSADDAPSILAVLKRPQICPFEDVFLALTPNWERGRMFFKLE